MAIQKMLDRKQDEKIDIFSGHDPSKEPEGLARKNGDSELETKSDYLTVDTRSTHTV